MKKVLVYLLAAASVAPAQLVPTAPIFEDIPGDTVIAEFDDGAKFTMSQFRGIFTVMNPQMQQAAMEKRREWLDQYALFRKLALMAEKEGLDKQSPTKEAIEFNRLYILAQGEMNLNMNSMQVESGEIAKVYDENKEKYKQVKVRVIYISFIPAAMAASGQKGLSEEQAKTKAEKLIAEIRKGADFVALVKANSDDQTSAQKNGEFGTLRSSDNIPDAIRKAVFSLAPGSVTDPVRQPNGFYILKADEIDYRPLSEVRDELYNDLTLKKHRDWMDKQRQATKIKVVSDDFFKRPAPTAPPAPAPKK